jgi:hypothetical protein
MGPRVRKSFSGRQLAWIAAAAATLAGIAGAFVLHSQLHPAPRGPEILVYSDAGCLCCNHWIDYMRDRGFRVTVLPDHRMHDFLGVPKPLQACHTALVSGYVIEGHVPAEDILRLLAERPAARGLTVPGMPGASPGMEDFSNNRRPYDVLLINPDGSTRVYSRH